MAADPPGTPSLSVAAPLRDTRRLSAGGHWTPRLESCASSEMTVTCCSFRCRPSPCGRLSRPRSTTATPPHRHPSAGNAPIPTEEGSEMPMVPTFTVVRSTGEAPRFAPAVSSWLRRRHSPRPAGPNTCKPSRQFPTQAAAWLTATTNGYAPHSRPDPPGSSGSTIKRLYNTGSYTYTFPSRSPGTARPVVPNRPDFIAAAPTHPRRSPGPGCRQLHPAAATAKRCRSLTSIRNNSASWRTTCSSTPRMRTPARWDRSW